MSEQRRGWSHQAEYFSALPSYSLFSYLSGEKKKVWLVLIFALMKKRNRFLLISEVRGIPAQTHRERFTDQGGSFGSWILAISTPSGM